MTDAERRLLHALALMSAQYLGSEELDHLYMSAGEHAVKLLVEYGLVEGNGGRGGRWTEAGHALLGWR